MSKGTRLARLISATRTVRERCLIVVGRCAILSLGHGKGRRKNVKFQHEQQRNYHASIVSADGVHRHSGYDIQLLSGSFSTVCRYFCCLCFLVSVLPHCFFVFHTLVDRLVCSCCRCFILRLDRVCQYADLFGKAYHPRCFMHAGRAPIFVLPWKFSTLDVSCRVIGDNRYRYSLRYLFCDAVRFSRTSSFS